jgi:hypothetical protein
MRNDKVKYGIIALAMTDEVALSDPITLYRRGVRSASGGRKRSV